MRAVLPKLRGQTFLLLGKSRTSFHRYKSKEWEAPFIEAFAPFLRIASELPRLGVMLALM